MTYTVKVRDKLVELIKDNLVDPRTTRNDLPVETDTDKTNNRYPYIIVQLLDNQKTGFTLGNSTRFHRHRIQVTVRLKNTNKYEIPIYDEPQSAGTVKSYLGERIDEIVQNNQDQLLLGEDIFTLQPDSSNPQTPSGTKQVNNDYILRRKRT